MWHTDTAVVCQMMFKEYTQHLREPKCLVSPVHDFGINSLAQTKPQLKCQIKVLL